MSRAGCSSVEPDRLHTRKYDRLNLQGPHFAVTLIRANQLTRDSLYKYRREAGKAKVTTSRCNVIEGCMPSDLLEDLEDGVKQHQFKPMIHAVFKSTLK